VRRDAEQPHRLVPKQPQHPGTIVDVELSDDGGDVSANGDIRYEEPLTDAKILNYADAARGLRVTA
jgi:hypothetical protein